MEENAAAGRLSGDRWLESGRRGAAGKQCCQQADAAAGNSELWSRTDSGFRDRRIVALANVGAAGGQDARNVLAAIAALAGAGHPGTSGCIDTQANAAR